MADWVSGRRALNRLERFWSPNADLSRSEAVHPPKIPLERLQIGRDRDAREFDIERQAPVSLPLPDVRVEGDDLVGEVCARPGDSVVGHREGLGVDAPAVHGPPDLVRREGRDRREEPEEVRHAWRVHRAPVSSSYARALTISM